MKYQIRKWLEYNLLAKEADMKTYIMISLFIVSLIFGTQGRAEGVLQKAKLELISHIESMVNIEECRKDIQDPKTSASSLPHSCDKIEYLSKYGFTKKDSGVIYDFLNKEESAITNDAKKIVDTYKIKSLGKMFLSKKCVLNRELVDMDKYLNKINAIDNELIVESNEKPRVPATPVGETPIVIPK
jgi:hypothetical protein